MVKKWSQHTRNQTLIRNIDENPAFAFSAAVAFAVGGMAESSSLRAVTTQKLHRQPLRILCADDNAELVELIAESLQFYGYRVDWVLNGEEALKLIAAEPNKFDLLITDMEMPLLDGYNLVVQTRQAGFRGKIIVFAGALSSQDRDRFGQLAVEAIIDKPANHRQLIGVVARLQTELWEQANADAA